MIMDNNMLDMQSILVEITEIVGHPLMIGAYSQIIVAILIVL